MNGVTIQYKCQVFSGHFMEGDCEKIKLLSVYWYCLVFVNDGEINGLKTIEKQRFTIKTKIMWPLFC